MKYVLILLLLAPVWVIAQEDDNREIVFKVNSLRPENPVMFKTPVSKDKFRDPVFSVNSLSLQQPVFFKIPLKQKPSKRRSVYGFVEPTLWGSYNKIGINVNEVAFVNWNAGGVSSVSGLINVDLKRKEQESFNSEE